MKKSYIIRMIDNRLFCCYHIDTQISLRVYEGGRWGKPEVIAPQARPNFSAALDRHGGLYLFYQDSKGDICLSRYSQGAWRSRVLLPSSSTQTAKIHIHPLIRDDGLSILYNSINEDGEKLILQSMDNQGNWGRPGQLDTLVPGSEFNVQSIAPEHALVFYLKHAPEPVLGYREVSPSRATSFHSMHSPGQRVADTSMLATRDTLHSLIVAKGLFSSQLLYRRKTDATFSSPLVLAEAAQISSCLLMFVGGHLHAYFVAGSQLLHATSRDAGASFSPAKRYTNKFCALPLKAMYLSHISMDESAYFTRQLYVDRNNVTDIQLLPELFEDFYPIAAEAPNTDDSEYLEEIATYKERLKLTQLKLAEREKLLKQYQKQLADLSEE